MFWTDVGVCALDNRFVSQAWKHCINNRVLSLECLRIYGGLAHTNNSALSLSHWERWRLFQWTLNEYTQRRFASWSLVACLKNITHRPKESRIFSQHRNSHETKFNCYCQCYTSLGFFIVTVQDHMRYRAKTAMLQHFNSSTLFSLENNSVILYFFLCVLRVRWMRASHSYFWVVANTCIKLWLAFGERS